MILFLDTELTDLINYPQLLSLVFVEENGPDFYLEVTDAARIRHSA